MSKMEIYRLPEYAEEATNMTSFHGSIIYASVEKLTSLFGEPKSSGDNKVQYSWSLTVDDIPFTLYDWKEYRQFRDGEIVGFHIGAHSKFESIRAAIALNKKLEEND